ncbi:MAG: hypothetical protein IT371_19505 [Deltaproteobacteria bacterium]|nr:hypothetical protein [Deltaproteobacteria bacterium]
MTTYRSRGLVLSAALLTIATLGLTPALAFKGHKRVTSDGRRLRGDLEKRAGDRAVGRALMRERIAARRGSVAPEVIAQLEPNQLFDATEKLKDDGAARARLQQRRRRTPVLEGEAYGQAEWQKHFVLVESLDGYRVAKAIPKTGLSADQQELATLVQHGRKGPDNVRAAAEGVRFRHLPYLVDQRFVGTEVRGTLNALKALEAQGVRLTPEAIQTDRSQAWLYLHTLAQAVWPMVHSTAKDPMRQLRGGHAYEYVPFTKADERAVAPYLAKVAEAFGPRQTTEYLYRTVDATYRSGSHWESVDNDVERVVTSLLWANRVGEKPQVVIGAMRERVVSAIQAVDAALSRKARHPRHEGIATEVQQAITKLERTLWAARNTFRVADELLTPGGRQGDGKYFRRHKEAVRRLEELLPGAGRERVALFAAKPGEGGTRNQEQLRALLPEKTLVEQGAKFLEVLSSPAGGR